MPLCFVVPTDPWQLSPGLPSQIELPHWGNVRGTDRGAAPVDTPRTVPIQDIGPNLLPSGLNIDYNARPMHVLAILAIPPGLFSPGHRLFSWLQGRRGCVAPAEPEGETSKEEERKQD